MNTKGYILLTLMAVLFSCKREFSSSSMNTDRPVFVARGASGMNRTIVSSAVKEGEFTEQKAVELSGYEAGEKPSFLLKKKEGIRKTLAQNNLFKKEVRKKIREQKQINKEMDPRLSRALWMTIFGGIATTLGIVFMNYAPTGLFVFAFGIVFLVGVVTLIMYLANPKPKM